VNDSDYAIGYGWGLSGRPTKCRYCRYPATKGRCHDNHFFFPYMGCTLAPPGEYYWTVRLRRRYGLMSNDFDHMFYYY